MKLMLNKFILLKFFLNIIIFFIQKKPEIIIKKFSYLIENDQKNISTKKKLEFSFCIINLTYFHLNFFSIIILYNRKETHVLLFIVIRYRIFLIKR